MTAGSVRAVIFDFNGVLTLPPASASLRRLCETAGLEDDVLFAGYWRHRPDYDRDTLDAAAYWTRVGRRTYTDDEVTRLVRADAATWGRANTNVVRWFLSLAAAGVRTAVLSNTPRDIWQLLAQQHRWLRSVDVQTLSFAARTVKPEPEIYLRCLAELKTAPAETVFVDDRLENVAAASTLGLRALHYRSPGELERALAAARGR